MKRNKFITGPSERPNEGCPKCGQEQFCPCVNCAKENAGKITWVWQEDGDCIACGKCGLVMSADQWLDLEMETYEKWKKWSRQPDE